MHSDSGSDSDVDESDVDDSNNIVHTKDTHAPAKNEKAAKILGSNADLPSAGGKYGWVEELFVANSKEHREEGEEVVAGIDGQGTPPPG